jgi:hypothetical protein
MRRLTVGACEIEENDEFWSTEGRRANRFEKSWTIPLKDEVFSFRDGDAFGLC